MFHLKRIEVIHWDYWQRFSQSLDAGIIAIVGPNGSGKTTLLDAMRTLFALNCSGKRDYKRYVRRADQPYAWLRAVVDNRRIGTFRHPFFPLIEDDVTLICRIRKQGGDWQRQYLIQDGNVPIDERLERSAEWIGVNDYKRRLESAGLTSAIAQVLSLEQGETDRLCEYTPKALLDLVFQVFGDKQVLDAYAQAKSDQREAEAELDKLEGDLAKTRNDHETYRSRANRYLQWRQIKEEEARLVAEIKPRLELMGLVESMRGAESQLEGVQRDMAAKQEELELEQRKLERLRRELAAASETEQRAQREAQIRETAHLAARDAAAATRALLAERDRLQEQTRAEHGADAVKLAHDLVACRARLAEINQVLSQARTRLKDCEDEIPQLAGGKPPAPRYVAEFRAALDESRIAHAMLSEIVEVIDPGWQAAVEALLAPYRHVVLLKRERDRGAAWQIGERLCYRHFVVANRMMAVDATPGSVLEVVRFSAEPPAWLAQLLDRVRRVENAAAGMQLAADQDWITRAGYHRERRGARHIAVAAQDYHFGEAARRARLAALTAERAALAAQIDALNAESRTLEQGVSRDQAALAGFNAAQMLAARGEEFSAAQSRLAEEQQIVEREHTALDAARDAERAAAATVIQARQDAKQNEERIKTLEIALLECNRQLGALADEQQRRHEMAQRLKAGMPPAWHEETALAQLAQEYGSCANVELRLRELAARLANEDWETDERVIAMRDKLAGDLAEKESRAADSRRECERARTLTESARGEYINVLRATIRRYGKNLRELGAKAGIAVEHEMPHLENDDLVLSQAGLIVRFDFDQKGMIGLNDGEASGGQQVMKSLILLIALMMDDERPGGFVFIDEPFAHLDIMNIDRVAAFLRATRAQYLITTPSTHNLNVFAPAQLTLVTHKKRAGERWAPPVAMIRRDAATV